MSKIKPSRLTPYRLLASLSYSYPSEWLTPLGWGVVEIKVTAAVKAHGLALHTFKDALRWLEQSGLLTILLDDSGVMQIRVTYPTIFTKE